MNFDVTQNAKNRFSNINTDATQAAKHAAQATKQKVVEVAGGIPAKAAETFRNAFDEAIAAFAHYGSMTAGSYSNAYNGYSDAGKAISEALRANDKEAVIEAGNEALGHFSSAGFDLMIADSLAIPLKTSFRAGVDLITDTVSLSTLARFTVPFVVATAIGYAALRLREVTMDKMEAIVENTLSGFDGVDTLDADDSEVPDHIEETYGTHEEVTVEPIETDGGETECPLCGATFPAPLNLAEHVATDHQDEEVTR